MLNNNFKKDFNKAFKYSSLLMPTLKEILKAKEIISLEECKKGSIGHLLDIHCGIDLLCLKENGVRGIAMRIQYNHAWNTFTIRKDRATGSQTELKKRNTAIENKYIYPYYTCQCYFNDLNDKLLSGKVCHTEVLYKYIKENIETIKTQTCKVDQNVFYVVPFENIKSDNIKDILETFNKIER